MGATPDRSLARACSRSVPTIPRGIVPGAFPKPSSLRAPGGGAPDFGGFAFRAFLPAKSSVLPAGCYAGPGPWPSWGSPLQGSLSSGGGRHFSSAARPSRAFATASRVSSGSIACPSGVFLPRRLDASLARRAGPHEVLHLVIAFSRFGRASTSGCRRWFPAILSDRRSIRFPSNPGVASPLPCRPSSRWAVRPGLRPARKNPGSGSGPFGRQAFT
jgi:hypothetical protein